MDLSKLQYHLKIILNGIIFIIRLPILQITTAISLLYMIIYGLSRLPKVKIKWDLNTSLNHYLKLFAVFLMVCSLLLLFLFTSIALNILLYYFNNYGRIALLAYWIYIYHYHTTTHSLSQKIGCMTVRNNFLSHLSKSYFPAKLVKTAELEPNQNYLMAFFPHGIMCFGVCSNMLFDISEWMKLFPGVRPILATLDWNFFLPFCRNVLHMLGFISVSKISLLHHLAQSNDPKHADNKDGFTSSVIGIAVGGVKEAEYAIPGSYKLVLRNRKGFVKIAIISGCSLVPSFCFGELELYDQVVSKPGTLLNWYQNFIKKHFGLWPAFIIGRGIFQENFGVLPKKKRVVQVVGAPIAVVQSDAPNPKYVDEIHEKFIKAVVDLFETHKKQYLDDYENVKLIIT